MKVGGLDSTGVTNTLVNAVAWVGSPALACGSVIGVSTGYSGIFHHVRPENANISAFEIEFYEIFCVIEVKLT